MRTRVQTIDQRVTLVWSVTVSVAWTFWL